MIYKKSNTIIIFNKKLLIVLNKVKYTKTSRCFNSKNYLLKKNKLKIFLLILK